MRLLNHLRVNRAAIAKLVPAEQREIIKLDGWAQVIGDTPIWKKTYGFAQSSGWIDKQVLRIDRRSLSRVAANNDDPEICFLLYMLWGYVAGSGRGYLAVAKMLQDNELTDLLLAGREHVKSLAYRDAFKTYQRIDRLGMSFLTKVIYFESRDRHLAAYCPIFDNRVARKLVKSAIDLDDGWLCDAILCQRGEAWKSYETYCNELRRLAGHLSVELDQLEYWLFIE